MESLVRLDDEVVVAGVRIVLAVTDRCNLMPGFPLNDVSDRCKLIPGGVVLLEVGQVVTNTGKTNTQKAGANYS